MEVIKNQVVAYNTDRPVLADVYHPAHNNIGAAIVFCHGFKGFKNWGAWHKIAEEFCKSGFTFVAFNLSHNGIGSDGSDEFKDLEGFAKNTYSKELKDLREVCESIIQGKLGVEPPGHLFLIGHSRGGAISLIHAAADEKIKRLATWASVATLDRFGSKEEVQQWKEEGVKYVLNGRTGQQMPMNFSIVTDYLNNRELMDVQAAVKMLHKPLLVVHGTDDKAVGLSHARRISSWHNNAKELLLPDADHVFNTRHPWTNDSLPEAMQEVVNTTIDFFMEAINKKL